MRLGYDVPSRLARLVFAIVMLLTWSGAVNVAPGQVAPAATPSELADPRAAVEQLDRCMRAIEAARRDIPRDTFDLAAVAATVGDDPAAALAWVREHTSWVPYRGALRGPLGVLMDRRGNSLDRATLLAELLGARGKTARLARVELSQAAAEDLRKQIDFAVKPPVQKPAPGGRGLIDQLEKKYGDPLGLQPANLRRAAEELLTKSQRLSEDIAQRTVEQSAALAGMVWPDGRAPRAPAAEAGSADVLASLRDHWWVQTRQGDAWLDLDPLFDAGKQDQRPAPAETIDWKLEKGRMPLDSKVCHEIELRVIIERWEGGRVAEETILRQPLRPAELMGTHMELSHAAQAWPDDLDLSREADPPAKLRSLASEQKEWLPILRVGESAYFEGTFTDAGRVNPKADLALFKKSGKAVGSAGFAAANLLDAGPAPAAAPTAVSYLTAEWIEYEVRVPGEQPRRIRRQIFDVLGPAARAGSQGIAEPAIDAKARLKRGLALLGQTEILPLACQLSPAFVDELLARNALTMRGPLRNIYQAASDADAKAPAQALRAAPPLPSRLYDLALARHSVNPHKDDVYFDRPNVLSLHQFLRDDADRGVVFGLGIDIVANELAVRPGVEDPSRVRLVQGVLDTSAETVLVEEAPARANNISDVPAAQPVAGNWLVVRNKGEQSWVQADVPKDLRARVEADLEAGYTVVLPRQAAPTTDAPISRWWRIDPRTGQALGINGQGWGGVMADYAGVLFITWSSCMIAAGYIGKTAPGPGGRGRSAVICALTAIGFTLMAPVAETALLLRIAVAGAATGGAAGGAL